MDVLPEIKALGDKVAKLTKRLPLNPDSGEEPVIIPKEEALLTVEVDIIEFIARKALIAGSKKLAI